MRRIVAAVQDLLRTAIARALLGGACASERSPPPFRAQVISTGDPELDPLASFLRAWCAAELAAGMMLVIEDRTLVHTFFMEAEDPYQAFVDWLLGRASDRVPAEMIRDFADKNRDRCAVWPELTRYVPARLLSGEERRAIFESDPYDGGWKRFYERHPKAAGLVTVSRVGLNREQDRALFYVACVRGALAAVGQVRVLEREGDVWVEPPGSIGTLWVS
jgi:hypothetical protein